MAVTNRRYELFLYVRNIGYYKQTLKAHFINFTILRFFNILQM